MPGSADNQNSIQRPNVYEIVAERLLEDITERRLPTGATLPTERELTERFGVGRSSVREAMRSLESHGVIRPAGGGQFVVGSQTELLNSSVGMLVSLGHTTLHEVHELRRVVEVEIAGLAAVRRDDADIEAIQRADREMRDLLPSREETMAADLRYHATVAQASHNRALVATATALRTTLNLALQDRYHVADMAVEQHGHLTAAIVEGDEASARLRAAEHMDWIEEILQIEESDMDGTKVA